MYYLWLTLEMINIWFWNMEMIQNDMLNKNVEGQKAFIW